MKSKELSNLTTIWLAITLVLAYRELSRRSGVDTKDWLINLRHRAYEKLQKMSDVQIAEYINLNFPDSQ